MRIEFSAGGIIYKKVNNKIWVLLCQHSLHHGWVFPKGLIGDHIENETKKETALREVKEETGANGKIIKPLPPVTYWYLWPRKAGSRSAGEGGLPAGRQEKVKKTVYYFLMEYTAGDITQHDTEMENVEWLPINKVRARLTYKSDKQVWKEARMYL